MTAHVNDVVGTFHDLCAGFGIDGPSDTTTQLRTLVSPSWNRFSSDTVANRSALTETGAPFEISIKIDGHGDVSLRYVVDTADHSLDITGNIETYIAAAQLTSGQPEGPLRQLFGKHLGDCAPNTLPTVMHGVGLASGGGRRSSIYFPAGWLDTDELMRRLPSPTTLPCRAEVVAYDFSVGGLTRLKTYHWLPVDPRGPMADHSEIEEQLPHAAAVYDHFASSVPDQVRGTATFLQQAIDESGRHQKVFFFTRPWGWSSPTGLRLVLGFLSATVEIDLKTPLQLVRSTTRNHGLVVHLGLVAIGGNTNPSLTLYFWPK
jgi:hypothetical protein